MANNMAIFRSMTHTANIGLIKNQFSQFIGKVQNGDTVVVCARNKPVAKIVSMCRPLNRTMEGFDPRVEIFADLEGPLIPLDQWRMLAD
jgi:antitoxin (DNA-binding transcriptional repressor) of toxin-antitoxin stability system